ncbi:bifunctional phosphopantothenoylcysteine decarboxylase/phosphopantothenate--cysteine ligase CoaBC [Weissella viridescens]|uniref:Coenzyme A biosynthesis bifunctional protein CoaBC n=1 Tax=Weissella viridescens TaxID=1629 RepID=A0A3P2RFD4_WEIVI|nr:bifunctional phosphopantothenoylcysteine decarboxylase/phosphopantothenate--cysteine ligase CoaBC [Weissella viridescens]RRG17951.1 bifunctional phosphopantothenoylcysteine decarboxylase/phosphopantothenate--cysteine ligase CoaBC [Weissella viridescens]
MLVGKKIVLVVTGGIAAYKAVTLTRLLVKAQADVRVVMTKSACEFVTPKTFSVLSTHPVLTDLFADTTDPAIDHIELADWADYMVVAPASANFIAKMAQGIADDAASSVVIARHTGIAIAPAMNSNMYQNPAVQRNLNQLSADGVKIMAPEQGQLAEGYAGIGRLAEPENLFAQIGILAETDEKTLTGKRVVVTAGGTQEPIDPVRYIANHSSGKMGYAFSQAAVEQGAQVTLITTVDLTPPPFTKVVHVKTAQEMQAALMQQYDAADVVIMAAAVADYRIAEPATQKMKKQADASGLTLKLVENPDILAELGAQKSHQYLVGFAAETQQLLDHAQAKLKKKHADLLIANDVSQADIGFGSDDNAVTLLFKNETPETLPKMSKLEVARQVLKLIKPRMEEA